MIQGFDSAGFNLTPSKIMHIDLNSCFATIEQQANHFLRGKPIGVVAYVSENGCILAPSIEAKKFGVKTGFRVKDARKICPNIIILPTDTNKYRYVHLRLKELLMSYTDSLKPKSIDEFVLDFNGFKLDMFETACNIKKKINEKIGDYITVSIGIGPNRFLAKTASNLQKPNGLNEINKDNYLKIYSRLKLTDLTGVAEKTAIRLNNFGIYTVLDLYNSTAKNMQIAFESRVGYYWYLKLRGWEIEDYNLIRKSFGNSHTLKIPTNNIEELSFYISKLVEKTSSRLRAKGFGTKGVFLGIRYSDGSFWHKRSKTAEVLFDTRDIYSSIFLLYMKSPKKKVRLLMIGCFNLIKSSYIQTNLFENITQKKHLTKVLDNINRRWGHFVIGMGTMINAKKDISDKIGFGNVSELTNLADSVQVW